MIRKLLMTTVALAGLPALAGVDHRPAVSQLVSDRLRADLSAPLVIEAVRAQNAKSEALTEGDIDALDKKWRAEVEGGGGEMTSSVMSNALSSYLKEMVAGYQGLVVEVFVMDDRGLNVGQADLTSDYWQGDEAKFQKTYGAGPDAVFVDEVEFDESSQTLQSQVSFTIVDPADGKAIGAVTVGVNVDALAL